MREQERIDNDKKFDMEINRLKKSVNNQESLNDSIQEQINKIKRAKQKEQLKAIDSQRKQDKVLFVAFYILLNLG